MITHDQLGTLTGAAVRNSQNDKIGKVKDVYESTASDKGTFITVSTGLMGGSHFVPLHEAHLDDQDLVVPYTKEQIKDAPHIADDDELTAEEEDRLYAHYGLSGMGTQEMTQAHGEGTGTATGATRGAGHDTPGPNTDDAMTVSEEHLEVGTQTREAGRARLRKYVTTETESRTVPVSHEEVVVTREPITEANAPAAYDGPAISEEEHEVTLTEQVPVAHKEAVPVERVRLDTQTVTEQATVSDEVRKERIDIEADERTGR